MRKIYHTREKKWSRVWGKFIIHVRRNDRICEKNLYYVREIDISCEKKWLSMNSIYVLYWMRVGNITQGTFSAYMWEEMIKYSHEVYILSIVLIRTNGNPYRYCKLSLHFAYMWEEMIKCSHEIYILRVVSIRKNENAHSYVNWVYTWYTREKEC